MTAATALHCCSVSVCLFSAAPLKNPGTNQTKVRQASHPCLPGWPRFSPQPFRSMFNIPYVVSSFSLLALCLSASSYFVFSPISACSEVKGRRVPLNSSTPNLPRPYIKASHRGAQLWHGLTLTNEVLSMQQQDFILAFSTAAPASVREPQSHWTTHLLLTQTQQRKVHVGFCRREQV